MRTTHNATAMRAFSLLSLAALAACGSSTADESTDLTMDETQSAQLPTETGGPADDTRGPQPRAGGQAPSPGSSPESQPAPSDTAPSDTAPGSATPGPASAPMPYRGINLAGAEFGTALPGVDGRDYAFPTESEVDYYMSKGMSTFRIGFKWERLQPAASGELDAAYSGKLRAIVSYAASKGATVILNPHNFARYYGVTVGSAQVPSAVFADLWRRLSSQWVSTPSVMFNLVNEPHDIGSEQWVDAANAAIAAIRATGATNPVVVPGNGWTGAHSWAQSSYGTPNSVAMLNVKDPANNVIFEAHQYLDATSGGANGQCMSTTIGKERLEPFVTWLRAHGYKGMIGELAGGNNATCNAAIADMLTYMMASTDVLVGWQWWAGGPQWGNYEFSLEPTGGTDKPQMAVIAPFL